LINANGTALKGSCHIVFNLAGDAPYSRSYVGDDHLPLS